MEVRHESGAKGASSAALAERGPGVAHVVVAEDNDCLRNVLAIDLRHEGYDVFTARDGDEAIDHLGALWLDGLEPDLILTDIHMPGRDGFEVLTYVNGIEWRVPVIVMSSFVDGATREEAKRLGALAVLDKPFSLQKLNVLIREALVFRESSLKNCRIA